MGNIVSSAGDIAVNLYDVFREVVRGLLASVGNILGLPVHGDPKPGA